MDADEESVEMDGIHMSKEEQLQLLVESNYQVNLQLPEEVKMIIMADPPMSFMISDATKSLGICQNGDEFRHDMERFRNEMRIIFTTIEHKGVTRGQEFCGAKTEQDDIYRSALDRMVHHGILIMSTESPEQAASRIAAEEHRSGQGSFLDYPISRFAMAGCGCVCLAVTILILI